MNTPVKQEQEQLIILFDGVCNLCNRWVQWIINHDGKGIFRFAVLPSKAAKTLQEQYGLQLRIGQPHSIILLESHRYSMYFTAVLRIARRLDNSWNLLCIFILLPQFIRDAIYRFIAAGRYQWFGRRSSCMVPTPDLKKRFL